MRQRAADSYREDRAEGGAAVLGMFGIPKVPNHAKPLTRGHTINTALGVAMPISIYGKFIEPILRYLAAKPKLARTRTN